MNDLVNECMHEWINQEAGLFELDIRVMSHDPFNPILTTKRHHWLII